MDPQSAPAHETPPSAASFCLTLEYDGTDFAGWQSQAGETRTVQGCLRAALRQITGAEPRVTGAGRTDAGVHAWGQVASVQVETDLEPERLQRALNGVLPDDVAVQEVVLAPPDFDARRAARSKLYRYQLWNGAEPSPLRARTWAAYRRPLDLGALRQAAGDLVGRHDFRSFMASGSSVTTTVRELFRIEVRGDSGGEIELDFEGGGFLRHMVRNLVGTLVEVGHGRRAPDSMPALLARLDRGQAGVTAPACGLHLVRVWIEGPHSISKTGP